MPSDDEIKVMNIIEVLLETYDVENWWPHNTLFEIAIGAILIQQTTWVNVEKVLKRLENHGCSDALSMKKIPIEELEILIRPCGFYHRKAKTLKYLASIINDKFSNNIKNLFSLGMTKADKILKNIHGIGEETSSSILLYAGNFSLFILDAYAKRIFERTGIEKSYYMGFKNSSPINGIISTEKYKDTHAAIVLHCQKRCKKKNPYCKECELLTWCNYGRSSCNK